MRPIFRGNKICSRKNSVHIIFVSVPSIERTLLFRRNRHFFGVPKPGFNLQLGYTFVLKTWPTQRGLIPGGVLPYITYTGMCRPKGSWFWSSWFRTGYPFQRRFLERGIIFRTHESSIFVGSHLKVFKDRLLLKIRFNALTSKALYSCCTLERSLKNWPIPRTGYQF